jgi:putative transcriptional regulator
MSEENIIRARRLPDGTVVQVLPDGTTRPLVDTTDYARLDAMTEDEIEANALSDSDNPPLTDEELERFYRVPNPKEIRQKLKMTQEQFAVQFRLSLDTLRDWEQGVQVPDIAARSYLRVIAKNPQAVLEALEQT